jgi:hypothetical protein
MTITPSDVYDALKTVKFIDLNKTRKDVNLLNSRKRKYNTRQKTLNMTRDNISSRRGTRFSGVFGKIANPMTLWKPADSRLTKRYPKISNLLFDYVRQNAPKDFVFDSITINHNIKCKRHVDRKNSPISFITSVGDFTGGELVIEDPKTKKRRAYNTKHRFLMYDGRNWAHWNNKIRGDKFSIIAYNRHGKGRSDTQKSFAPYFTT